MIEGRRQVLVTGAGGFIGRNLVRDQLDRGYSVTATDVDLSGLEAMKLDGLLRCHQADIRSTSDMRPLLAGCDRVFHLAAAHLDVLKEEAYFHEVNVRAAEGFARIAAEEGVGRFVHCSTVGVYGALKSLPADEETRPAPDIPYEETKLAGERAVREALSATPTSSVILRPAWVYGPYCPRTLKLIRTIARRRFIFVGDGRNFRHPVYIGDMLEAFELAATRELPSGEVIIIAGPEAVSIQRLVELVITELGMDYAPLRLPAWFMEATCLAVEKSAAIVGREPPFSRRSLKFFSDSSEFAISKALRMLEFEPQIDTRKGLQLTIQHYRERGLL
jgi:nucleoside-diphosphate-sugar epimerase